MKVRVIKFSKAILVLVVLMYVPLQMHKLSMIQMENSR